MRFYTTVFVRATIFGVQLLWAATSYSDLLDVDLLKEFKPAVNIGETEHARLDIDEHGSRVCVSRLGRFPTCSGLPYCAWSNCPVKQKSNS